jgi:DNA/RNA endonuclease YhcR with UshA esterase domain
MRTIKRLSLSVAIVALASVAYAQRGGGGNYNPATETTVKGVVEAVENMPSPGRGGGGLHLKLTAPSGPIDVHIGPSSFVASKNVTFAKGDALTVVGSKVTMDGQEALIAREITKGDQVLTLRDAKGFPLWSGRGRGQ